MRCIHCGGDTGGWGKDGAGHPRFRCKRCRRTFARRAPRPLGAMRLPLEKALLGLSLLLEGSSVRGAERVTGVHRDTLSRLLVTVGRGCEPVHRHLMRGFAPSEVECATLHDVVVLPEGGPLGHAEPGLRDALAWVEVEPRSKLVVRWGLEPGSRGPRRPSRAPATRGAGGGPHAARHAQVLQAHLRRLAPRTQAFSRKWVNLEAALALHSAHYNLCRIHSALRYTPAMAAELTERLWSLEELVRAATAVGAAKAASPAPVSDPHLPATPGPGD